MATVHYDNETIEAEGQKGLFKPTLQITVFSILGILVSFVTQIIIAAKFGATMERDAYFAAVVVPTYVTTVLVGSLTVTFVPIFIEYETKKNKEEAWKVASIFTNLTFLVLFGISLLGFIFARQLISAAAPGFKGEELLLTASLLRIILPAIIFSGLTSLLSSIYYTAHQFLRPAIVPVINTVFMLLSVVFLTPYWGIKSLAFGYLIGTIFGFLILVPIFSKQGRYSFSFDFSNEGVRQIIKVMTPLVLAGLFYRASTLIQRMIASTLPTGSISYLGYAMRITSILGGIATAGISTTIFPVMARSWVENDLVKVREYFAKGVRIIMLITFPIAMVFIVLRVPIIQVIFERGAFDHKTTVAVADVLAILMVAFISLGLGNVVGKGFYLSQKTKLLAILGIMQTVLYIGYAYTLAVHFSYTGLAVATSLRFFFPIILNTMIMRTIYKGIEGGYILKGLGIVSSSTAIAGILTFIASNTFCWTGNMALKTSSAAFFGLCVYAILVFFIFRMDEAISIKTKITAILPSISSLVRQIRT